MTRKQAIAQLWLKGDISYKLHSGQLIINERLKASTGKLNVLNCSRQWGKSFLMVTKVIELALNKPKSRIRYGAAFHTDLIEFIIPAFQTILEDCPLSIKPTYKVKGSKWVFKNGSEIKLIGLDKNPDGMRGNTVDYYVLDECGFVSNLDYIYKDVILASTIHRPNAKIVMISTPPKSPAHEFSLYAQQAEKDGNYSVFDVYQNPMLTPETIAKFMHDSGGEESTTWRREYLCQFVTDKGLQIVPEWKDDYVQEPPKDEFYPYYHKYTSMDLGVKDKTAIVFGYYDFKRATMFIEAEVETVGVETTEDIKNLIVKKETELWGSTKPYRRIADSNNLQMLIDMGSMHGLHFSATTKETNDAMWNEVRLMVSAGRLVVSPQCPMTIGCLKYGVFANADRKTPARSPVYGHFDHLDATKYLIRNIDTYTNPISNTYGMNNQTHFIGKNVNETKNAKTFKKLFNIQKR